ncbi:MAG: ATPase domain-containing protein [Aggregatilineales bacterium]
MKIEQEGRLDRLMTVMQSRWGQSALYPARPQTLEVIATGIQSLDDLLGVGGLPTSTVTALCGVATSGMTTLAQQIMAQAQSQGKVVAYFDLSNTFDGDYARLCGVDLRTLLVVRSDTATQALDILCDLIVTGDVDLVVLDAFRTRLTIPGKLQTALSRSRCALLTLQSSIQDDTAFIRLHMEREKWLRQDGDVTGVRTRITLEKHRLMPAGRSILLDIPFAEVTM